MTTSISVQSSHNPVLGPDHLEDLKVLLVKSVDRIGLPGHSAQAWNDLMSVCIFSRCIEQQGAVQGLGRSIADAADVLNDIYTRNMLNSRWQVVAPNEVEVACLKQLADVHIFQLSQLGLVAFEEVFTHGRRELVCTPRAVESDIAGAGT